jgi:hypothetical protein
MMAPPDNAHKGLKSQATTKTAAKAEITKLNDPW